MESNSEIEQVAARIARRGAEQKTLNAAALVEGEVRALVLASGELTDKDVDLLCVDEIGSDPDDADEVEGARREVAKALEALNQRQGASADSEDSSHNERSTDDHIASARKPRASK